MEKNRKIELIMRRLLYYVIVAGIILIGIRVFISNGLKTDIRVFGDWNDTRTKIHQNVKVGEGYEEVGYYNGFRYTLYENEGGKTASILGYQGSAINLEIPETIEGYPVDSVYIDFYSHRYISRITIPNQELYEHFEMSFHYPGLRPYAVNTGNSENNSKLCIYASSGFVYKWNCYNKVELLDAEMRCVTE